MYTTILSDKNFIKGGVGVLSVRLTVKIYQMAKLSELILLGWFNLGKCVHTSIRLPKSH